MIRNEKRHNYAVTRPTGASNCMWEHGSQYVEDTFVFQDVHNHCELSATFKQEHSSSPSQNKFATDGEHSSTTYRIMLTAVFVESTAANGTRWARHHPQYLVCSQPSSGAQLLRPELGSIPNTGGSGYAPVDPIQHETSILLVNMNVHAWEN